MNPGLFVWWILVTIELTGSAFQHNKKRTGKHNFWISLFINFLLSLLIIWIAGGQLI